MKEIEENGVPFDEEKGLRSAQAVMTVDIQKAIDKLYEFPEIVEYEKQKGSPFNPNSTLQLREVLFDCLKLTPTGKKTGTGADSTDAEVARATCRRTPCACVDFRDSTES